jgi:hypothetical protein
MPEVTNQKTNLPLGNSPPLCSVDQCGEPAVFSYVWDWGEAGYACAKHAAVLQQTAKNLKRNVTITALAPGAPQQIGRDERTRLIAAKLAAEAETEEVKVRNAQLYQANRELTSELGRQRACIEELESQHHDLRAELEQVTKEKMTALRDLGELETDRARLEGMLRNASVGKDPVGALPPPTKPG